MKPWRTIALTAMLLLGASTTWAQDDPDHRDLIEPADGRPSVDVPLHPPVPMAVLVRQALEADLTPQAQPVAGR